MKKNMSTRFCISDVLVALLYALTFIPIIQMTEEISSHSVMTDYGGDNVGSSDDSREKRSREEIMFGNQQNKPSGIVDDIMGMAESMQSQSILKDNVDKDSKNDSQNQGDGTKLEDVLKDDEKEAEKRNSKEEGDDNTMSTGGAAIAGNWYNSAPVSADALQYLLNTPPLQPISPMEDANSLYDQEEVYRRKRQLLGHPLPLRKRSLRSPLGQMIQAHGRRLPRRSMRLKRQVDVEDLLSLLGSLDANQARYYEEQGPTNFNFHYQDIPETEFRYPYNMIRNNEDIAEMNDEDLESKDEIPDNLMMLPPGARYVDAPDFTLPYRSRVEDNVAIPDWMERAPQPSIFSVSRRSAPVFYPLDYRYVPGYRKRSRFGNRSNGGEEPETDMGKWGKVVQVPEAYASAEDVARLYALANLMADGEKSEGRPRRSL